MEIATLTAPRIARAIRECPLLVLPLGATEQHGPALPVNTDTVIASAVCNEAARRAGVCVAPPLAYTSSAAHTTKWPGTFSLTPSTLIDTLVQWTRWAEATGWKRIYFVSAHVGNDAPVRVAVDQIRLERLGYLQIGYTSTFALSPSIRASHTVDGADFHANRAEADLMLHLAPDTVDRTALPSADDPDRTAGTVFSYPVAQTSINGTTGSPSEGDPVRGRELFEEMASTLASLLTSAKTESPPLPPEYWAGVPENFYQ